MTLREHKRSSCDAARRLLLAFELHEGVKLLMQHRKLLLDLDQQLLAGLAVLTLAGFPQMHTQLRYLLRSKAGTTALELVHQLIDGIEIRRILRRQLCIQFLKLATAILEIQFDHLGNEVRVAVILQLHQLRELFIEQALCQQLVQQAFQLGIRSHNYPPPGAGTVQLVRQRSVLQL